MAAAVCCAEFFGAGTRNFGRSNSPAIASSPAAMAEASPNRSSGSRAVARAMKESIAILEPLLTDAGIKPAFTAVIGTVKGDLHDIGKNLVGMMWKGANIEVIDLGSNVAPEVFVAKAREHEARLVGISALLTTTMVGMRDVVEAIRAADLGDVKVVVGGAPVTAEFAASIGADGYAPDAASAVELATRLMGTSPTA